MAFNSELENTQKRLIGLGYNLGEHGSDGYYGSVTDNVVNQLIDKIHGKQEHPIDDEYVSSENHFPLSEFTCHNGEEVPPELYKYYDILRSTVLEVIRHKAGDIPLHIMSGYRTQYYNDNVVYDGEHHESMHCICGAADIKLGSKSIYDLGLICKELYNEGIIGGLGLGKTFIHVDIRNHPDVDYANNRWLGTYNGLKNYSEWVAYHINKQF